MIKLSGQHRGDWYQTRLINDQRMTTTRHQANDQSGGQLRRAPDSELTSDQVNELITSGGQFRDISQDRGGQLLPLVSSQRSFSLASINDQGTIW